jgi:hypothetical protein
MVALFKAQVELYSHDYTTFPIRVRLAPPSIPHPKRRRILRSTAPSVIKPGRGDIRMPQPFLDLGNISGMFHGVCSRGGPQGMHAEARHPQPDPPGIFLYNPVMHRAWG